MKDMLRKSGAVHVTPPAQNRQYPGILDQVRGRGAVKSLAFMVAFFVSTAIHAGALESTPQLISAGCVSDGEESREACNETGLPIHSAVSEDGDDLSDNPDPLATLSSPATRRTLGFSSHGLKRDRPARISVLSGLRYPRLCRIHNEEGTAEISVEILADGKLGEVEIIRSSGYRRLDRAAVSAIRQAELIPARENGRYVNSKTLIAVRFDLEDWGE